ncbi:MAG: hypothetical protein ACRBBW_03810 [Cellvibrionaceae bacterium]
MPASSVSIVGTGTKLLYENPASPGTYIHLVNATVIGSNSKKGAFIDNSPISPASPTYIAGDEEAEQKEYTFNDVPGDSDQEDFIGRVINKETLAMRVEQPNGVTFDYQVIFNGYESVEPTRTTALGIKAIGQRTGDITRAVAS